MLENLKQFIKKHFKYDYSPLGASGSASVHDMVRTADLNALNEIWAANFKKQEEMDKLRDRFDRRYI